MPEKPRHKSAISYFPRSPQAGTTQGDTKIQSQQEDAAVAKLADKALLKDRDAVSLAAQRLSTWLGQHGRWLTAAGLGAVVLVLLAWGAGLWGRGNDRDSAAEFARGWRILEAGQVTAAAPSDAEGELPAGEGTKPLAEGTPPPAKGTKPLADGTAPPAEGTKPPEKGTKAARAKSKRNRVAPGDPTLQFADKQAQWSAAKGVFDGLVKRTGLRGIGVPAAFVSADLAAKLGSHEAAAQGFEALQKALKPQDLLYFVAAERVAYEKERQHDMPAALAALAPLATDDKLFYADYAQLHQARLEAADGHSEAARNLLEHLERAHPSSSLGEEVRGLLELMPQPAEPSAAAAAPQSPEPTPAPAAKAP
jgi:hypothetical protein